MLLAALIASFSTPRIQLVGLIAACAFLSSLEVLFPLFQYRSGRARRAVPNLILASVVVLMNLAFASITASVCAVALRNRLALLSGTRSHPSLLAALGVAGLDFFAYLAHLLLHKVPLGWRFHVVHHSELEVDVTTAFRQHPGETFWRLLWQWLGIAVLGLPLWVVPVYLSASSLNALLEHANVRMRKGVDRFVRLFFVTPNMHKIHHSERTEQTDSNYANIFSVWDRICGTHTPSTDYRALRYGLGSNNNRAQTVGALITEPFRTA